VKTAIISDCGNYRYELRRIWDHSLPPVMFIGLNPSTADATKDDPTIRRCISFATAWSCGSIIMVNCYAFRATNPSEMKRAAFPVGPLNDSTVQRMAAETAHRNGKIVAAWGAGCSQDREIVLRKLLTGREVWCLGKNKNGSPKHPLYVPSNVELMAF